jgi:hypothetical protein
MPVNPITGMWEYEDEAGAPPAAAAAPPPQERYQPNFDIPGQRAPMGGGGPTPPMGPMGPMGAPTGATGGPGAMLPNEAMGNNVAAAEAWQKLKADQEAKTKGEKIGGAADSFGSGMLGLADLIGQGRKNKGFMGAPANGWIQTGQPGITDLMKILSGLNRPGR